MRPFRISPRFAAIPFLFFGWVSILLAETAEHADDAEFVNNLGRFGDTVFSVNNFFDTTLPGTLAPYDLALDFRPRLGDFVNRRYIRFPLELRYGVTDRTEVFGLMTPVIPNPIRRGKGSVWSLGEVGLGFRYNLDALVNVVPNATFSMHGRTPLGRPPVQLIDGYAHVESRLALMWPLWEERIFPYLNLVYDHSFDPPGKARPHPDEVTRQHIGEVISGIIYKPHDFGYVLQYTFRNIEEPNQTRHAHAYRVGVIWEVPRERSAQWRIPGKWQLEISYELTDEQQRDLNHAILLRARWRLELSRHATRSPGEE